MIDWKPLEILLDKYGFPVFVALWLLWERRTVANILINRMDRLISLLEDDIYTHGRELRRRTGTDGRPDSTQ